MSIIKNTILGYYMYFFVLYAFRTILCFRAFYKSAMQLSYFLQRIQHFWIRLYAHIYSVQLSVCVSLNLRTHSVDARVEHGGNTSNGIKGARVSRKHGHNSNRVRGRLNAITSATDYRCYVFSTFLFLTVVRVDFVLSFLF